MAKKQQNANPNIRVKDEIRTGIDEGLEDKGAYEEQARHKSVEDDEMEPWEEGFMEGAEGRGQLTSCARCGKLLDEEKEKIFEKRVNGKKMLFCSREHAEKGQR